MRLGTQMRWRVLKGRFKGLIKPGSRVLDIGGFDGLISSRIEKMINNVDITLMDLDEEGLKLARDKGIKAINASACAIPFKDDQFDTVLCLDVIEHIKDDQKVINEIARVLKKGGKLIFATPMLKIPFGFMDESRRDFHTDHERSGYSIERLREMFSASGLKIIKEDRYFNLFTRMSYYFATSVFKAVLALEPFINIGRSEYIIIGEK